MEQKWHLDKHMISLKQWLRSEQTNGNMRLWRFKTKQHQSTNEEEKCKVAFGKRSCTCHNLPTKIVDLTILCNSRKTSLLHYMPFARPKKPHALWVLANENSEHWNDLKMNVILERHLSKCPWEQISLCQSELGSCGKNCCGKDHQIATGQGPVEHHPCASSAHFWKCCPWSHWKGSQEQLGLEIAMSGKVKSMRPMRESRQWFTSVVNL